jgi:putative NADH-flavin reductase
VRTVAIIGASHGIGLACVTAALDRGLEVRALARSALSAARRFADKDGRPVTWIAGDSTAPEALQQALAGAEAVIVAIGMGPTRKPVSLFSATAGQIVAQMQAGGPRRLLWVSGIGAGDTRGRGGFFYDSLLQPLLLNTIYADKDRAEAVIAASALDWTIVRPGFLTNAPASPVVQALTAPAAYRPGSISRSSVAAWMLDQIERAQFVGKSPLVIG